MKKLSKSALDPAIIDALAGVTPPVVPTPDAEARMRHQLFQRVHAATSKAPDYLFVHSHQGEWTRLMRGVELKLLRQDERSRSYLLRMAPGARIPPHAHPRDEECLVLEGSATVNGVECGVGDYHLARQGSPHDWLTSKQGCVLFIRGAVDSHAPHTG
ncbi:MAG: cupin domain-containing protein [Thiobacillus sp.]|nr:cupin domain-containing protein [Thiobacillus sp.]